MKKTMKWTNKKPWMKYKPPCVACFTTLPATTFLFFTHGFCAIVVFVVFVTVTSNSIEVEAASIMPAATAWKTVVEPTPLKNMSQIGSFPQIGVKMKNIWNHHLDKKYIHLNPQPSIFPGTCYCSFRGSDSTIINLKKVVVDHSSRSWIKVRESKFGPNPNFINRWTKVYHFYQNFIDLNLHQIIQPSSNHPNKPTEQTVNTNVCYRQTNAHGSRFHLRTLQTRRSLKNREENREENREAL